MMVTLYFLAQNIQNQHKESIKSRNLLDSYDIDRNRTE